MLQLSQKYLTLGDMISLVIKHATTQNHPKPFTASRNHLKPAKTSHNYPKPVTTTQNHLKPAKPTESEKK